jgi:hypothetical protein
MIYSPSVIARQLDYIRESATQNRGLRVEAIQHWSSGQYGDSWCCEFVTMVLDICFKGNSPIPRGGVCQTVYNQAKLSKWMYSTPVVDDLYLYVNSQDHAHHIGIVTSLNPLTGIAGNTSKDGTSSNGNGVYEHGINAHVFIHYPR